MENREKRKFLRAFILPFFFVSLLWIVKGIEGYFDWNFTSWGIKPRDFIGLRGVLFSPFIHGDLNHLFNNSVPLLILGWALFYFYKKIALRVVFWSYLLAGLYTWISARTSYHIGASGLVYSLFGFIFISGFIRKNISLISISFLSAFLYGSLIWGILPWDKSVSWEGHFWGLFVGLVLAVYYREVGGPPRKKYSWEIEEELEEEHFGKTESQRPDELEYEYHFIPKQDDKEKKE